MDKIIFLGIFMLCGTLFLPPVHAQQFVGIDPEMSLTQSPLYPTPNSSVTVSLAAFGLDLKNARITWSIDGVAQTDTDNVRSVQVPLGEAGTATEVVARVTLVGKTEKILTRTITPGAVDIVLEPDTNVPLGYLGRPLPSNGSIVRAIAVPQLYSNGKRIPENDLLFTWTLNGDVLFGGATPGKNVAIVSMPRFGNATLTVRVEERTGTGTAQGTVSFRAEKPFVLFYEESSLYGTLLSSPHEFVVPKEEIVVRAEPLYLSNDALGRGEFAYSWMIDGKRVENPSTDPREITLKRVADAVRAKIGFTFTSTGESLDYGNGSFAVTFTDDTMFAPQ